MLHAPPGEFWKTAQSFYRGPARREPDEATIKGFVAACSPFRALVVVACVPEYEYWMRDLICTPESYPAGAADLFSAVYLPYCRKFVTHDTRQRNGLKLVLAHADVQGTEIVSYEDFRKKLISKAASCDVEAVGA